MSEITLPNEPGRATPPASKKSAKRRAGKKAAQRSALPPSVATKKAKVIALMRRKDGASLDAIVNATGWQKHTVRGFISILGSKGELKLSPRRTLLQARASTA
jgi:hypothetical protein